MLQHTSSWVTTVHTCIQDATTGIVTEADAHRDVRCHHPGKLEVHEEEQALCIAAARPLLLRQLVQPEPTPIFLRSFQTIQKTLTQWKP